MVRKIVIAGLIALTAPLGAGAVSAAEAPAPAPAYSTNTDLGTLLDNPATKAVLDKYIHDMISNQQIDMARGMTLRQLQAYAGDTLTNPVLTKIDADLASVPAAK